MLPVRRSLKKALDQESETESEYESSPSPSPPPPPPYNMSHQQQPQQQGAPSQVPAPHQPTHKEQLLAMIATLQQQVNNMLLQQQGSRVEIAKPQVFNGRMEEVSAFINAARIYIRMKMTEEVATTQVAWVLSYIQGGVAEAWKVLSRGSECLSDHPRWMFKKNLMEFFVGLQSYLYYCYSGCTLKSHDHLLFPECSMVT